MTTELITTNIWATITKAVKASRKPCFAAVAYFGKGASRRLPLSSGSYLVVDASPGALKSGQTCPDELLKLYKKDVHVFSAQNLHAKVFVVGTKAFVGSTNVSNNSANTLLEAIVSTTDNRTVSSAKRFVLGLRKEPELGPVELKRLSKLYRPPKLPPPKKGTAKRIFNEPKASSFRIVRLKPIDYPEGSDADLSDGTKSAHKKMDAPRRHCLDDFFWRGKHSFRVGDTVMQILEEGSGKLFAYPPGKLVHIQKSSQGKHKGSFLFVERPAQNRIGLDRLNKKLQPSDRRRLQRGGRVAREIAERLEAVWRT